MDGARVLVRVIGPTQVVRDGVVIDPGSPTQRRILAALAIRPRRPVRAESLAELVGLSPSALRVSISRLRKLMGPEAIVTGPSGYFLDVDTDVQRALAAFTAADRDLASMEAALADWRGVPFLEFATEPWATAEHARLSELHALAVEERAELLIIAERFGEAVAELCAHIDAYPYRDNPRGLVVRALAGSGRIREALQAYHEYRTMLVEEIGIEPSADLQQIERRVSAGWDGRHTNGSRPVRLSMPQHIEAKLFGREPEIATLRAHLADAITHGRLVSAVVAGDAGIGKTSLLEAFAATVAETVLIASGRCDETVSVPLQPFRTIVDRLVAAAGDELLNAHAATHRNSLAIVSPVYTQRVGPHLPSGSDDATDRFLLFEAVADLIRRSAHNQPLVLLLDDLHWAEPTALQLLRHIVRTAGDAPVLVVASARVLEQSGPADLRSAVAKLARATSVRIDLGGLGKQPLAALIRTISNSDVEAVDPTVVRALDADTAGNPLLATHLVRHWLHTGRFDVSDAIIRFADVTPSAASLPPTLRDIVWARLSSLGADAPAVLAAAALFGDEIAESTLMNVVDAAPQIVTEVLDAAVRAGILTEADGHVGALRFTHALVAAAITDDIPPQRLRRLHERAARALERTGVRSTFALTRIAHHWDAASSPVDALRAAIEAGDAALLSLAAEEAVHWYRRAVTHAEAAGSTEPVRAAVLVRLGKGLQRAGDASAVDTLLAAAGLARRCGDHDTLVQAAEATGRGFVRLADFAPTYVDLVEQALTVTLTSDPGVRARLLAMLAAGLIGTPDAQRREQAASDALMLADTADDPLLIARIAPDILRALLTPGTDDRRADVARRAQTAAASSGDPYLRFVVTLSAFQTWVCLGNATGARRALAELHQLVGVHTEPRMRWLLLLTDTFVATMEARFDHAERLANDAVELGMSLGEPDAFSAFASQFFVLGTFAGRYAEMLPVIDQALAAGESATPFRLAHAIACAVCGRRQEASAVLDAGRHEGFNAVPQDGLWLTSIVGYAVLAIELDDHVAANQLLPLLEPFVHQVAFNGATSQGPVAAYLGRLASLLGRHDDADRYLNDALTTATEFGWEYHRASTLVCRAESRIRPTGGMDDEAKAMLDEAERLCKQHGIGWWAQRIIAMRR